MTRRFLCTALLLSLLAAAMLLCACGSAGQSESEPDLQTALHTVTDVTTDVTDTTAPAETTVSRTTAVTTEADKTVETFAAVTEADPTEFQHRGYADATDDPNEEEHTLPTVVTVRTTVRTTARTTTAQTTRRTGTDTAKSTATTITTTTTTTTTTVPLSGRQAEMQKLVKSYKRTCAVLMTAQDGTVLFSYQPDKAISGASLIKLPYVYFCCVQLSGGVRSLEDSVTYTADWYHGGSGIIRKNGYGKTYTVAQLIDYALRYSDNVAYDMLVYLFGIKGFDDMVKSWGYSVSISASRFPPVTASFMTAAMTKMQASSAQGGCWAIAWDALTGSVQSYVRDTLGISGVAVKYGSISAQYHETCYVPGEMPYTLVILSGAVNYQPDVTFVQNVARCAQQIAACYEDMIFTQPTTTTTTETTTTTGTTTAASETSTGSALTDMTAFPAEPAQTETTAEGADSD